MRYRSVFLSKLIRIKTFTMAIIGRSFGWSVKLDLLLTFLPLASSLAPWRLSFLSPLSRPQGARFLFNMPSSNPVTMTKDLENLHSTRKTLSIDPNSVANVESFTTKHIHLDWFVNFDTSVIEGSATLSLLYTGPTHNRPKKVCLDCSHLEVSTVKDKQSGRSLTFRLDSAASKFGGLLEINLDDEIAEDLLELEIFYKTTKQSSALQWLQPEQTIGKRHPYLFSQAQAIHARTMLPCQDTPFIKATYTANVRVRDPLVIVMSANIRQEVPNNEDNTVQPTESTHSRHSSKFRQFQFRQTTPIPAYLIAIGGGALVSRPLGPRSAVWSEAEMIEAAAYEFAETESFIATAEQLVTPYVWGRYDILLLPPSFPYGGMENPCLTFLTPSLLTGDRSLVDVVAHEIAHSWTGNLVSCRNWEHFWLNEGFTMFLERKILARIHGESWRQFNSIAGLADLRESVKQFGENDPATALVPNLEDTNPDDVFSSIPYEKGYTLLYTLEELVGGPSSFEPFFKAHIERFAGRSIDSAQFKAMALEFFADNSVISAKLQKFDWDTWFYGRGMPPTIPTYDDRLYQACCKLAQYWLNKGNNSDDGDGKNKDNNSGITKKQHQEDPKRSDAYHQFTPAQRIMFYDILMEKAKEIKSTLVDEIGQTYSMDQCNNVEILLKWYLLAIRSGTESVFKQAAHFATQHGRMKYCRPIYRELFKSGERGKTLALSTFNEYKNFYHPIAAHMIAKDLQLI